MKNILKLFFATLCCSALYSQSYHTVNNMPGAVADFTTLHDAINAASPGDVILLEGSTIPYENTISGNTVVNKSITIQGPGYFLGQNNESHPSENKLEAIVKDLEIAGLPVGSNVEITGITWNLNELSHDVKNAFESNIYIRNCRLIGTLEYSGTKKMYIYDSYWEQMHASIRNPPGGGIEENWLYIEKCILLTKLKSATQNSVLTSYGSEIDFPIGLMYFYINKSIIVNEESFPIEIPSNIIRNSGGGSSSYSSLTTAYGENIIVSPAGAGFTYTYNTAPINYLFTNPYDDYMIVPTPGIFGTQPGVMGSLPGETHNIVTTNYEAIFVGYPNQGNYSADSRWQYKPGSIAAIFPYHGLPIGAFQSDNISTGYKPSGFSRIPVVNELTVEPNQTLNSNFNIKVKATGYDY